MTFGGFFEFYILLYKRWGSGQKGKSEGCRRYSGLIYWTKKYGRLKLPTCDECEWVELLLVKDQRKTLTQDEYLLIHVVQSSKYSR